VATESRTSGWFGIGAALAAAGIALGAFGAHGLQSRVEPRLLEVFETGVRYHMYHALGLLAVGWAATRRPGAWVTAAGWLFVVGILVFSGSLYLMTLTGSRWLGAITPIGGVSFITGWVLLAVATFRSR
jgi:uncharacterized membrane protein YgdD (TMEM256/DUF423 family)